MSGASPGSSPWLRRLSWGLLAAAMLAVAVTAVMAPRWRAAPAGSWPLPPVLGEVPAFELVNRDGGRVTGRDLLGAPWVADFIFTRCSLSCPRMTARMVQLPRMLSASGGLVRRVSFSVDPDFDTPAVLQQYADSWGIEDPRWLFLTGAREAVEVLVREGFRLAVDASPPAGQASPLEPILHSTRFVLVDAAGAIRGYYDVARGEELARLARDLAALQARGPITPQ